MLFRNIPLISFRYVLTVLLVVLAMASSVLARELPGGEPGSTYSMAPLCTINYGLECGPTVKSSRRGSEARVAVDSNLFLPMISNFELESEHMCRSSESQAERNSNTGLQTFEGIPRADFSNASTKT